MFFSHVVDFKKKFLTKSKFVDTIQFVLDIAFSFHGNGISITT